ncbi:RNA polymerase sigma factor [Dyadobacter chenwenxiniae]|uniref:RNA polymerase sigma factor n=1 Tax=Dyadobacter chenwenxiniae TaxID=2906456 RepID=A0A9X1PLX4_9BACT|nr:RNA polymerase sigma factor [Dyadobacter chenwenxiniae]MCF0062810.1 RNA polymerase sigma factor [Dyadobacter chenwenxiniae]UON85015.1 RNA polymerase sigma factor [Dyadobacter chenwenxiniae]
MDNISKHFWEDAYRQNIGKMIAVCWRYTHDRQTAEDLAHDAFVVAIGKVTSFKNRGPFEAWLRRIVVNVALQYLRQQKEREKIRIGTEYPCELDANQDENPGRFSFSEIELLEVISNLPEHHKLVFNLYVIDNFTHAQIAAQLGISEGTSKSHLARARKKIRELLNERIRDNKRGKKSFPLFILPYQSWGIDGFIFGRLKDLQVQPKRLLSLNISKTECMTIPKYVSTGLTSRFFFKAGLWAASIAIGLGGFSHMIYKEKENGHQQDKLQIVAQSSERVSDFNSNKEQLTEHLFSDSITATIPENLIIVEKTKNGDPMKNLSTLSGVVIASLSFNSIDLAKELPVQLKNRSIEVQTVSNSNAIAENGRATEKLEVRLSQGTFYAQKLLWSETRKLYFLGDNVKVDFNTNRFVGSGRFSFLEDVNHLVINGIPLKMNEAIKLSNKKYNLNQLNAVEGLKKYGEDGKNGVVEITVSE